MKKDFETQKGVVTNRLLDTFQTTFDSFWIIQVMAETWKFLVSICVN